MSRSPTTGLSLSALLLALLVAPGCGDGDAAAPSASTVRMLVLSDPHYFDPSLGTTGSAFDEYFGRDRKLIAESDAIMRAMVGHVEAENPDVVLVTGDLTKDGEMVSHLSAAAYLRQMKGATGRRIFVVPGNHDIQNGGASRYDGAEVAPVDAISAADFASIYADLGFGAAIARDASSLSYVAELGPGLWLFALDSCIYGETRGEAETAGRLLPATRQWISAQLDLAKQKGIRVVGMMHHGLIEHFGGQALIFPQYLVDDRESVAALLSNGGMGLVFTGHFHAHDVTQAVPVGATGAVFDVETGSTVTYPCPYRVVDVGGDKVVIQSKLIPSIDDDLGGAADLQSYARSSLRSGLEGLIAGLIQTPPYSFSGEDAAAIAPWLADGLVAHYAGDEVMPEAATAQSQALRASAESIYKMLAGQMLQNIWTDLAPADNTLTIDLAAR